MATLDPVLVDICAAVSAGARRDEPATLAVVLETEGSTYVGPAATALFSTATGQVGWLSGGCLEPRIERAAHEAAMDGRIAWMEVDTTGDDDLLVGGAPGCRGCLRIALLPLRKLPGIEQALGIWLDGREALEISIHVDGAVGVAIGSESNRWRLEASEPRWSANAGEWQLRIDPRPSIIIFGAGPETPTLLPLLRQMGWITTLVERRRTWQGHGKYADRHLEEGPAAGLHSQTGFDAAVVMHHDFELDRETMDALAGTCIPYIGLLGPDRRRKDLYRVLPDTHRDALNPRLRSPIGLELGGRGPRAIALSIVAQLQAWLHQEKSN